MPFNYDYDNVAHRWFEELQKPFVNYLRANYTINYDDAMDLYVDSWIDLRKIILEKKATEHKWKALLFTIGCRKAMKIAKRRQKDNIEHFSSDKEVFNRQMFEVEAASYCLSAPHIFEDPALLDLLGYELGHLPELCNKILKFYYFDELSMTDIAETMNYTSSRTAITTKNRCLNRLKTRIKDTAQRFGII